MSSVGLIKAPSWRGLSPGLPQPVELPAEETDRILKLAGLSGRVTGLRLGAEELTHYRIQPTSGPPLFLKFAEPAQRASFERAEAIAVWLAANGVSTAAALDGYPRTVADGRVAVVSVFVDGRRIRPDAGDLAAFAGTVARLHRMLAVHPDRREWQQATRMRLSELKSIRAELAAGRLRAGPRPDELRDLAADTTMNFDPQDLAAAPLHGDLNPGNVLMGGAPPRPILLDFEDVFHSVLPPVFELLLLLERFVLVQIEDDDAAGALAGLWLDAYRETSGYTATFSSHSPSSLLQSLSLRSLCVLALGERAGIATADSEWEKFFELIRHARRRTGLLEHTFGVRSR